MRWEYKVNFNVRGRILLWGSIIEKDMGEFRILVIPAEDRSGYLWNTTYERPLKANLFLIL
jgi:hypothetical protein